MPDGEKMVLVEIADVDNYYPVNLNAFETASDICKQCFDGNLVTRQRIREIDDSQMPQFIGITNRDNQSNVRNCILK